MHILIRKVLWKGNSLRRNYFGNYLMHNRIKLLHNFNIQTLLDVGANTDQFAYYSRKLGYKNTIISFEPLSSAFMILEKFARKDPKWHIHNCAVGDSNGDVEINISANLQSSSLLDMMPDYLKSAPDPEYLGTEEVSVFTLDTLLEQENLDLS
jgi:FkbM family methyltransferase